ncbi:MaoC family dehydratase N-terminal domain-containing protein [Nocardia sp. 2]|uniref:MaoC family dehydratase N-terminal domain-containing protein n=1 Tax=Nocardia acididurans TaxID=2802282 RepID=A0ABS1M8P8_9NOCA|nr:fused (3R)-hydroxyacyl-ACP dehydratase subunits HadA/HadB [Nocardia acididurans]MBL1076410.1 MaoC family dehydratase N-terminal domain-containing protein [Nocardia acididurans]
MVIALDDTMQSMVGRAFRLADYYEVGREQVRAFAGAVRNDHPLHRDDAAAAERGLPGLLASPTFTALLGGAAQTALATLLTDCDLTVAVQTQQQLDFHRPVCVGDRLTSTIALQSHRRAFGGDLLEVTNHIADQDGRAAVTSHTSLIARSAGGDLGKQLADLNETVLRDGVGTPARAALDSVALPARTVPQSISDGLRRASRPRVAVGDHLPARAYRVTYGDLVHYAGLSGDPNPIHWHEPAAALAGLGAGVVAHGMLTMGLGAGYLVSWAGDPRALRQYTVRWSGPLTVVPGTVSTLEFGGKIMALCRDSGIATVALTATQNGRRVFGRATAAVLMV